MIRLLSSEVQGHLRSGVAIASFAQCTEELVVNALDAGAMCVAVRVDLSCGKVQVVDNGSGMTKDQLAVVANRYATSKCHTLDDLDKLQHYGYRGEALASIRDMCLMLDIESRHKHATETFDRIFKSGRPVQLTESVIPRHSPGTTVTVHDLFHRLPVRKKAVSEGLEFEAIRRRLEAIALIHPQVSFSLRNDVNNAKVLQTHKCGSVLGAFTHLHGMSKARMMKAVEGENACFKVTGHVNTEAHHNKSLQFIYVNRRLVLKTKLHKLLNFLLSKSLVLRKRGMFNCDGSPKRPLGESGSPQKMPDKHAIYVISISCPLSEYDITFDPRKTLIEFKDWSGVVRCVEDAVKEFLERENLLAKGDSPDGKEPSADIAAVLSDDGAGESQEQLTEGDGGASILYDQADAEATFGTGSSMQACYGSAISTDMLCDALKSGTAKRPSKRNGSVDGPDDSGENEIKQESSAISPVVADGTQSDEPPPGQELTRALLNPSPSDVAVVHEELTTSERDKTTQLVLHDDANGSSTSPAEATPDTTSVIIATADSPVEQETPRPSTSRSRDWPFPGKHTREPKSSLKNENGKEEDSDFRIKSQSLSMMLAPSDGDDISPKVGRSRERDLTFISLGGSRVSCSSLQSLKDWQKTPPPVQRTDVTGFGSPSCLGGLTPLKRLKECVEVRSSCVTPPRNLQSSLQSLREHKEDHCTSQTEQLLSGMQKVRERLKHNSQHGQRPSPLTNARQVSLSSTGVGIRLKKTQGVDTSSLLATSEAIQRISDMPVQHFDASCNLIPGIEPVSSGADGTAKVSCLPESKKGADVLVRSPEISSDISASTTRSMVTAADGDPCPEVEDGSLQKDGDNALLTVEGSLQAFNDVNSVPESNLDEVNPDAATRCTGDGGKGSLVSLQDILHQVDQRQGGDQDAPGESNASQVMDFGVQASHCKVPSTSCASRIEVESSAIVGGDQGEVLTHKRSLASKLARLSRVSLNVQDFESDAHRHKRHQELSSCLDEELRTTPSTGTDHSQEDMEDGVSGNEELCGNKREIRSVPLPLDICHDSRDTSLNMQDDASVSEAHLLRDSERPGRESSEEMDHMDIGVGLEETDLRKGGHKSSSVVVSSSRPGPRIWTSESLLCAFQRDADATSEKSNWKYQGPDTKGAAIGMHSSAGHTTRSSSKDADCSSAMEPLGKRGLSSSWSRTAGQEDDDDFVYQPKKQCVVPMPKPTHSFDLFAASKCVFEKQRHLDAEGDLSVPIAQLPKIAAGGVDMTDDEEMIKGWVRPSRPEWASVDLGGGAQLGASLMHLDKEHEERSPMKSHLDHSEEIIPASSAMAARAGNDSGIQEDIGMLLDKGHVSAVATSAWSDPRVPCGAPQTADDADDGHLYEAFQALTSDTAFTVQQRAIDLCPGTSPAFKIHTSSKSSEEVQFGTPTLSQGYHVNTSFQSQGFHGGTSTQSQGFHVSTSSHSQRFPVSTSSQSQGFHDGASPPSQGFHNGTAHPSQGFHIGTAHPSQGFHIGTAHPSQGFSPGVPSPGLSSQPPGRRSGVACPMDDSSEVELQSRTSSENPDRIALGALPERCEKGLASLEKCTKSDDVGAIDAKAAPKKTTDESSTSATSSDRHASMTGGAVPTPQLTILGLAGAKKNVPLCTSMLVSASPGDDGTEGCSQRTPAAEEEGAMQGAKTDEEESVRKQWVCQVDKTGKKIFVNIVTGNTSYAEPIVHTDNVTRTAQVKKLHPFRGLSLMGLLPTPPEGSRSGQVQEANANLSPVSCSALVSLYEEHQKQRDTEDLVKWRGGTAPAPTGSRGSQSIVQMFENWDNPVFERPEQEVINVECGQGSSSALRVQQAINPHRFTKDMFSTIKVLGQLDRKFIACLICTEEKRGRKEHNMLIVVDQHAAHERVRLEQLTADAYEGEAGSSVTEAHRLNCSAVMPPLALTLTEEEVRVVTAHRKGLEKVGVHFTADESRRDAIHVYSLPACLVEREANELRRGRPAVTQDIVEGLVKEQVEALLASHGASAVLPKTIIRLLNSQACHGAIKFGDQLEMRECEKLIGALSECNLPFQCAHGRPALMPILDLEHFHRTFPTQCTKPPNLWRLRRRMEEEAL